MPELSCREFIQFLDEYVDEYQSPDVRAKFEHHLAACPYCVDYLKTYRDTIALARGACADDPSMLPPDDIPEKLIEIILNSRPSD